MPTGMSPVDCLQNPSEAVKVRRAGDEVRDVGRFGLVAPEKGNVTSKAARIIAEPAAGADRGEANRA